jgi:hypothetical protein
MESIYHNPLDDRRVMLALEVDDIKGKCKELRISFKKLSQDQIDMIFYQTRKGIENGAMDIFWYALESAIEDSIQDDNEVMIPND